MQGEEALFTYWQWQPTVVVGCIALIAGYLLIDPERTGCFWLFVGGVGVLLVALISPIDVLGDYYLFSVHMMQHLLLIVVVPPLMLLGLPPRPVQTLLQRRAWHRAEHVLSYPVLAWLLGMGTLWIWHVPVFYDAALRHEGLHTFEHLTFLITATVFWWPVLAPLPAYRMSTPGAGLYLFAAYIASSILGVLITFAPTGIYTPYLHPIDVLGILPLLRDQWGLTPRTDQQIGGLLMWVVGGIPYFGATWIMFVRWYLEDREPAGPVPAVQGLHESGAPDILAAERATR